MAPLVVQVVDQNERAMEGAEVVFRFPLNRAQRYLFGRKNYRHRQDQRRRSGRGRELDGQRQLEPSRST